MNKTVTTFGIVYSVTYFNPRGIVIKILNGGIIYQLKIHDEALHIYYYSYLISCYLNANEIFAMIVITIATGLLKSLNLKLIIV